MKRKKNKKLEYVMAITSTAIFIGAFLTFFVSSVIGPNSGFLFKNPISVLAFADAYIIDNDMRQLALDMTNYSCGSNQDCVIVAIYNNLSKELSYSFTPYERYIDKNIVWQQKSGDCKSVSGLYVNLLINMGIVSYIDSSIKYRHAVAVAEPMDEDYFYVVDLTIPNIQRFNKGTNFWPLITGDDAEYPVSCDYLCILRQVGV
jgi:hypothetical protein